MSDQYIRSVSAPTDSKIRLCPSGVVFSIKERLSSVDDSAWSQTFVVKPEQPLAPTFRRAKRSRGSTNRFLVVKIYDERFFPDQDDSGLAMARKEYVAYERLVGLNCVPVFYGAYFVTYVFFHEPSSAADFDPLSSSCPTTTEPMVSFSSSWTPSQYSSARSTVMSLSFLTTFKRRTTASPKPWAPHCNLPRCSGADARARLFEWPRSWAKFTAAAWFMGTSALKTS